MAGVSLTPANFDNCTIKFDPPYVNQTSIMYVRLDPNNALDSTTYITVTIPRHYTNDIVPTS